MAIALVTGGAGFIGSHLVERLLEAGAMVRVLDDLSTGSVRNLQPKESGAGGRCLELIVGDVRDAKLVRRAMRHVDRVFHLAALPASALSPPRLAALHAVNVQGTLNVLQAAVAEGVGRVVFASCASVYGPAEDRVISEEDAPRPSALFAASKLAGEIYCRTFSDGHGLETVALRYFEVYGPRQSVHGTSIPAIVDSLRRGVCPILGADAHVPRDVLHVDDAVAAALAAAEADGAAGLSVNVASAESAAPIDILQLLKQLLRTDPGPRARGTPPAGSAPSRVDTALARRALGWLPKVTLVDGLARLAESADEPGAGHPVLVEAASREECPDL